MDRSQENVDQWRAKDPIRRLKDGMIEAGIWTTEQHDQMNTEIEAEIRTAWELALNDPYPVETALLDRVYGR